VGMNFLQKAIATVFWLLALAVQVPSLGDLLPAARLSDLCGGGLVGGPDSLRCRHSLSCACRRKLVLLLQG